MMGTVRTGLAVPARLREIAICAVASVNGAPYEFHHHAPELLAAGGSEAQVEALGDVDAAATRTDLFDRGELAALRLAVEMTRTVRVGDGTLNLSGTFTTTGGLGKWERTGGTVKITGIVNNTGATLALNAGTGSWLLVPGGTIRGGNVTTSGGAALQIAPVVNAFATLDGLTLDTDVTLENVTYVNVVNGLTVNGTLSIAAPNGAGLDFLGTQTLGGKGQVIIGGIESNRLRPQSGTLTIGPALTIRGGSGAIGDQTLPLINEGAISADVAGGVITIRGNPFTNNGTTQELNGGKILVNP
jgi:hypothetical protein